MLVVFPPTPFPRIEEKESLRPFHLPVHVTIIGNLQEGEVSESNPFLQAHLISSKITLMN